MYMYILVDTWQSGVMVNNHLTPRAEAEDKGGYCKP